MKVFPKESYTKTILLSGTKHYDDTYKYEKELYYFGRKSFERAIKWRW